MENTRIRVGEALFDVGEEYSWLSQCDGDGAVVTFTGKVRNYNQGRQVSALTLEHYPNMAENTLREIIVEARKRWPLQRISVIHRTGLLLLNDEIVFVGVTCACRSIAFDAAAFIMDYLKTRVPFWKREATTEGEYWLAARIGDKIAASRW